MIERLQRIKDEVANDNGWSNWDSATPPWIEPREVERLMDEVSIRYAQDQNKELLSELEHVTKALKVVASFGATTPIIVHAEQLINKHKGDKS